MEMGFRLVTKMSTVEINQTIQALVCQFFIEPEIESQTQQSSFLHFQIVAAHPFPCSGFGAKFALKPKNQGRSGLNRETGGGKLKFVGPRNCFLFS